jgi:acetylcholinesterase
MYPLISPTTLTAFIAIAIFGNCSSSVTSDCVLQVNTSSGVLDGFVNPSAPNVRQFLGIPFAIPPTGTRRWLPPSKLQSTASINVTNIGPACPQQPLSEQANLDVYSPYGGNQTEFFPPEVYSEDCLTLNVWTPKLLKEKMPVLVWYFGGGFVQGGTSSLYYNPQSWVQRTQEHIVVTVNFRSNIFGFPNAAELADQNLGLLDQRLAVEWVRDNIANFGGDTSKIVYWGQSAGAIACDYLNFAYPLDPIVSGIIMDSGTSFYPQQATQSSDTAHVNFGTVAKAFCPSNTTSQIDCLRHVPWQDIEAAVKKANLTSKFLPVADGRIVFPNYTQRYEMGALSSAPAIIGTNQHEFNALIPGVNETLSDSLTNTTFLCTAAMASQLREAHNRTTYRYRYDGNFSNISPPTFPAAYHAAELPLIFGTAGEYHGASTPYENLVSRKLQDTWLEFAKDPQDGLRNAGWSPYGDGKAVLIGDTDTPVKLIDISQLDSTCATVSVST